LFAGDEETVALSVVSDAIEHGFSVNLLVGGQEAGAVDPVEDVAVVGIDADDAVGVPDVGVDDAIDVFELVELVNEGGAVVDDNVAGLGKVGGIAEAEGRGAVAGDELGSGAGDAPAFAVVVEGREGAEGGAIEDEAGVGLPGPFDEVGAEVDNAFAEVLRGISWRWMTLPVTGSVTRMAEWPSRPVPS